jgi:hypothetical protein
VVPDGWSASAPRRVVEHLRAAPDGPARVLHQSTGALYVEVAGRCVGVIAPRAAQVPCALRLPARISGVSAETSLAVGAGNPYVERGTLYLAGHPLRVGRFVDVRVPRIDLGRVLGRAAGPAKAEARPPRPAAPGLAALQGSMGAHLDTTTASTLVGNGDGLTPLGDDVLCGWLGVLVATDRLDDEATDAVRQVLDRTTLLSATLLDCALHGEVLPEFAAYLTALGTVAEDTAARALMAIGHTSGAGLWWGARHALSTLALEEAA